jgi:hypothetical protein
MAAETVLTYLDSYCERAGMLGAFAEPLNLFTNAFFIIAAILSTRHILRTKAKGFDLWLMVLFMFSIGVGSGLWHALPSGTTVLMDVIPITLFINAYIISSLRRLFRLSWAHVGTWWLIYFVAGIAAQKLLPADLLNGTIMYIPTYLTLAILTMLLRRRDMAKGKVFTTALIVWSVSLLFRTVDHSICPSIGVGTHFLWHTLNAWVLWRLLKVLIDDSAAASRG